MEVHQIIINTCVSSQVEFRGSIVELYFHIVVWQERLASLVCSASVHRQTVHMSLKMRILGYNSTISYESCNRGIGFALYSMVPLV